MVRHIPQNRNVPWFQQSSKGVGSVLCGGQSLYAKCCRDRPHSSSLRLVARHLFLGHVRCYIKGQRERFQQCTWNLHLHPLAGGYGVRVLLCVLHPVAERDSSTRCALVLEKLQRSRLQSHTGDDPPASLETYQKATYISHNIRQCCPFDVVAAYKDFEGGTA